MAQAFFSSIQGIDLTTRNLRRLVRPHPKTVRKAAIYLTSKMKESAGLEDHSIEDLRALGYPYSRSFPRPLHSPDWLVHRQTGTLANAIGYEIVKSPSGPMDILGFVGIDTSKCSYAPAVIYGTPKMVSRDFVTGTFVQEQENLLRMMMSNGRIELNETIRKIQAVGKVLGS